MNELLKIWRRELEEIIDCIDVGIYITDGTGNTLLINRESARTGGLSKEQVVGVNVTELLESGFMRESACQKVLASGKPETLIQQLGDGGTEFISAKPLYRNGRIEYIVCTERDITEVRKLQTLLDRTKKMEAKYRRELERLRRPEEKTDGGVIAESGAMQGIVRKAVRVAASDATVLLTGESGTGKEVIARLICQRSARADGPYIRVNCAAIPENLLEMEFFGYEGGAFTGAEQGGKTGILEQADGGTLFLDEIGEMPVHMQSKLLGVIQDRIIRRIGSREERPVDFRLIAATNRNLKHAMEKGEFREDMYYSLNIIPIRIPPLRERKEDIEVLALHFIEEFNRKYGLSKVLALDARTALSSWNWPGNVRELRNIIERTCVSFDGNEITGFQIKKMLKGNPEGSSQDFDDGASLEDLLSAYEREILTYMMRKYRSAAIVAKKLNVSPPTLSRRLKKYQIQG